MVGVVRNEDGGQEELFERGMRLIVEKQRTHCTAEMFARGLHIPHAEAERLIEEMIGKEILGDVREPDGFPVLLEQQPDADVELEEVGDLEPSEPMPGEEDELDDDADCEVAEDLPGDGAAEDETADEGSTSATPAAEGVSIELKVDPELRDLIAPLRSEELAGLRESLRDEGCRDSLVVWQETGILLDGHNRYQICRELALPYKVVEIPLSDRLAAKLWILGNQVNRRNLTDDQRAHLVAAQLEIITEINKRERATKGGKARAETAVRDVAGRMVGTSLPDNAAAELVTPQVEPKARHRKDTRASLAKAAHLSERKVRQAQTVQRLAPELAQQVQAGELPLRVAIRQVKDPQGPKPNSPAPTIVSEHTAAEPPAAATGVFDVLEANLYRLTTAEVVQFLLVAPQAKERALRLAVAMRQAADDLEACVLSADKPVAAPAMGEASHD